MPVALVTGASKGIGAACATELARAGFDVALTYAVDREGAESVAAEVARAGRRASVHPLDTREAAEMDELIERIEDELGPIEAMVANAGVTRDGPALRMDDAAFREPIEVNLIGTFATIRPVARRMARRRAGSIVALSSVVGRAGNVGQVNYAASKAGLAGMVRSLARELGPRNVRVNAVAPGFISTRLTEALDDERTRALLDRTALGRLGEPADVAGPVRYLCGPASAFVTGTVLAVDGGLAI